MAQQVIAGIANGSVRVTVPSMIATSPARGVLLFVAITATALGRSTVTGPAVPTSGGRIGDVDGDGRDDLACVTATTATIVSGSDGTNLLTLPGASLSLQSIVVDPAANALGLVTSNAIDITTNN